MSQKLTIALIAHDRTKPVLLDWFKAHFVRLKDHNIVATGTTGRLLKESVKAEIAASSMQFTAVQSGPFGGDQQVGAMIAEGKIDAMIFFEDVLTPQPHDVDVKALLRLAVLYEVPVACNRATADMMVSSELFFDKAQRKRYPSIHQEFEQYLNRTFDESWPSLRGTFFSRSRSAL